jgi:hypothetical protein
MTTLEVTEKQIARQLHDYMQFRAKEEGQGYGLDEKFFLSALRAGCAEFFGVTFDGDRLLADQQQPDLFAKWQHRLN